MASADQVSIRGTVIKTLPNTRWEVEISGGQVITAHLGGKLRKNNIRITPGDNVQLEMSPYDLTMGRIVWRFV